MYVYIINSLTAAILLKPFDSTLDFNYISFSVTIVTTRSYVLPLSIRCKGLFWIIGFHVA